MRRKSLIIGVFFVVGVLVAGCGDSSAKSSTTAASSATTAAVVTDATKVSSVTRPSGAAGCQYNGPNGLLVSVQQAKISKADQATFDAYVKGQESATTTKVSGVGDGDGASATHDINTTVYGLKGTTVVAVAVFKDATDPAGSAKALAAL